MQLVKDIKKAKHFTSHGARLDAIAKLQEAHGLEGVALYSYVTVKFCGFLMFVSGV